MTKSKPLRAFASARRLRSLAQKSGRVMARHERLWIGLAIFAILLVLGAFAAIQFVLSRRLVTRWVNTDPGELLLGYDSASSWVPGVLRIRGLTLRGRDPNVEWFFRMEDATIQISLPDLLFKRFHATRVRAQGLVFHLRQRMSAEEMSSSHAAMLPEIPGFPDPPRKAAEQEPAPLTAREKRMFWSVQVDDLVADPTPELWIEIYRFRGHASVAGSFLIHPHTRARVGPAQVRFLSGNLLLAPDRPLLASNTGVFAATIAPYDPEKVRGSDVWPLIDGRAHLDGRLSDLRFLNHFLEPAHQPRLEGGGGDATIDLHFDRGIGSGDVTFQVPRVGAIYTNDTLRGRAKGRFAVARWDQQHDAIDLSGSHVELSDIVSGKASGDARAWWAKINLPLARVKDGFDARAVVSCRDARPLYTLLQVQLPAWAQGVLKLEGLEASARIRLAPDLFELRSLEASGGKFHIAGLYSVRKTARQGAFLVENGSLALGVAIDGEKSHLKLLGARRWFETVQTEGSPAVKGPPEASVGSASSEPPR